VGYLATLQPDSSNLSGRGIEMMGKTLKGLDLKHKKNMKGTNKQ
jgi:hypothetical protein